MKKLILSLLILSCLNSRAQVKDGEAVPDLELNKIINAPVTSASLAGFKGKIVIIDFWATWCGSCIVSMPRLDKMQQKYAGKLQVLAVTDETEKRTRQFLTSKPSKLWFVTDTGRTLNPYFPHRMIPHSVLIGPDGRLITNTSPEAITDAVVDSILRGQQVHLSVKKDLQYTSVEELIKTTFPADKSVKQHFVMDGEMVGAPGLSTTYATDSVWSGRRLSALNCNLAALYRIAYGDFAYERTIDKTTKADKAKRYRLDIIVEQKANLLPALRAELAKRFDIQAKTIKETREVYVLKLTDPTKLKQVPLNTSGTRTYSASHGAIDQQAITMTDFAQFLETFAMNQMVVDETGNTQKFDIKFTYQPENPQSITDILTGMGLKLEKEKREVEMLVLYKNSQASL